MKNSTHNAILAASFPRIVILPCDGCLGRHPPSDFRSIYVPSHSESAFYPDNQEVGNFVRAGLIRRPPIGLYRFLNLA